MSKYYRIIFEEYDTPPKVLKTGQVILEGDVCPPTNCLDFGISHEQQIALMSTAQDKILKLQADQVKFSGTKCSKCGEGTLTKHGSKFSWFNDIFSDHRVKLPRRMCNKCNHVEGGSVTSLFGQALSGELLKIQSELGAKYSYRDSEELMTLFSHKRRRINNHEKIHTTSERIGESISTLHQIEEAVFSAEIAEELIIHVDGGHINSKEEGQRSFEVMTSAVYRPESVQSNPKGTRNYIESKHCAASAHSDSQTQMKKRTIIAALKEGLAPQTKITALCDGANNCWNIIDSIEPLAFSTVRILDWFHIAMKIKNIALPEGPKEKLEKIKWHLWRGNCAKALQRLTEIINICSEKPAKKLQIFRNYIQSNQSKIVNYEERKEKGLPFTSNLAESTVESLINQRCKGQKHMRWSREGIDPILQIRASIASKDWGQIWKTVVASI